MYEENNPIVCEDLDYMYENINFAEKFKDSTILVTGCAGFLGYYFMKFFARHADKLGIKKIIGLDKFIVSSPDWLNDLQAKTDGLVEVHTFDIISDDLSSIDGACDAEFVLHMASIASPTFYRQYPIETLDANIWGLRKLLDIYCKKDNLRGFLMFSSSEIYGDPDPAFIPTAESYRGNVASIGPRACYDESKRFSETMCYLFAEKYNMPIAMARPFNNFGPGMSLNDKRVPADFAKAVIEGQDIEILSDGTPTRTFCYVADAVLGYLKILTHGTFDVFNIGNPNPEISMRDFAKLNVEVGKEVFGYQGEVKFAKSEDADYMTDNPNRRCPIIDKARSELNYHPTIGVREGVERFMKFFKYEQG